VVPGSLGAPLDEFIEGILQEAPPTGHRYRAFSPPPPPLHRAKNIFFSTVANQSFTAAACLRTARTIHRA
jgi:hypothetical protein